MSFFENKVIETIQKHNMLNTDDIVVIGLSGGADSCCLLYVLKQLSERFNLKLIAAHLNHGIRGIEAKRDMEFSESFAHTLGIKYISEEVNVPQYAKEHKISEETAGRKLRYDLFNRICKEHNCNKIAVAHHLNDRVETILMNLIRGCGSNGFLGIKPINGKIIRPLIGVSRIEIEEYALEKGIHYVTDTTNSENVYTRNIIRNKVINELTKINPNALNNIIRTSDIVASESKFISDCLLKSINFKASDNTIQISKASFDSLDIVQKRKILLHCITTLINSTENISYSQIENAIRSSSTGKQYKLGDKINLIYTAEEVILTIDSLDIKEYEYLLPINNTCYIKETKLYYKTEIVEKIKKQKNAVYIKYTENMSDSLKIRTRKNGDTFIPSGLNGSKKVKKFYIDNKIPLHERHNYPLLEFNGDIVAIIPLRVSENYIVKNTEDKILKISVYGGTNDEQ